MKFIGPSLLAAAAIILAGCAHEFGSVAPETSWAKVEQGRVLAEARCASCHAIDFADQSRNAQAPPFRMLSNASSLNTSMARSRGKWLSVIRTCRNSG